LRRSGTQRLHRFRAVIERLLRSADFERVLRTPIRARSAHFAAHHVGDTPSRPVRPLHQAPAAKLSTTDVPCGTQPVDESSVAAPSAGLWLGAVVPKRHAKRAVTRNLLKRQIRAVMAERCGALASGLWVIRLRAPFDVAQFPSARSQALRDAARAELRQLLGGAVRPGH
jgi:ribonuclease P protein component